MRTSFQFGGLIRGVTEIMSKGVLAAEFVHLKLKSVLKVLQISHN